MKNKTKKILATMAIGIMSLAMPFTLAGCDQEDDVNIRIQDDYIQWQIDGNNSWTNLITIEELKDLLGDSFKGNVGEQGMPGINGREVEFRKSDTHIQWRYVTNNDNDEWNNLIAIDDIRGKDFTAEKCTITMDLNLPYNSSILSYINSGDIIFDDQYCSLKNNEIDHYNQVVNFVYESKVNKGDYFQLVDFAQYGLGDYFLGWYADGVKIDKYRIVAENLSLKAHWKEEFSSIRVSLPTSYECTFDENNKTARIQKINSQVEGYRLPGFVIKDNYCYKVTSLSGLWMENSIKDPANKSHLSSQSIIIPYTFEAEEYLATVKVSPLYWCDDINFLHGANYYIPQERVNINNDRYILYDRYLLDVSEGFSLYELNFVRETAKLIVHYAKPYSSTRITGLALDNLEFEYDNIDWNFKITEVSTSALKIGYWQHLANGNNDIDIILNDYDQITSEFMDLLNTKDIVMNLYFKGTKDQYDSKFPNGVNYGELNGNSLKVYYYVEEESNVPSDGGNYWHYDTNGKTPIVWNVQE